MKLKSRILNYDYYINTQFGVKEQSGKWKEIWYILLAWLINILILIYMDIKPVVLTDLLKL